ncbi:hypothetical protein BH09BAC1_BH09BAC1_13780 [soil metagenome]
MNSVQKLLMLAIIATASFASCKKGDVENPHDINEEELITTVTLAFTDSANTANVLHFTFSDPDGAGGNGPTQFDTIKLQANTTYYVAITLLDESGTEVDTISNEVLEEGIDHQFFFHVTGASATITYTDSDDNGNPIGLQSKWVVGSIGTGTAQVILKHQPDVKAPAPGNETLGETDVEVDFPLVIW